MNPVKLCSQTWGLEPLHLQAEVTERFGEEGKVPEAWNRLCKKLEVK